MTNKSVVLKTTKDKFFRQYLEVLKVFPPFNNLRNQELDVLSELYKLNNLYKDLDYDTRWKLILHYDNRIKMHTSLDLTEANFNNILTSLRKKDILINNTVPEKYLFVVDDEFKFTLNFQIAD